VRPHSCDEILIAEAAGIPPLVALVRDGNAKQKESAAGALRNLAVNDDNKIRIAEAGGIPPLVALVRDGNAKQRESAVGALGDLAVNDDNKHRIEEAGGIPPLVALVRDGNAKQRESAAGALENLAVNDNKILIAEVEALAALVRDGNADQKVSATDALRILARRPEAVERRPDNSVGWYGLDYRMMRCDGLCRRVFAIIAKAGGIPPLVALVRDGTWAAWPAR